MGIISKALEKSRHDFDSGHNAVDSSHNDALLDSDKKIFVPSNLVATFSCPSCKKSVRKDVSKFFKNKTLLKLKCKCSCQNRFLVILERRRSIRKVVHLEGHLKKINLKNHIIQKLLKYTIKVENLSKHGFRIKLLKKVPLKVGEKVKIEFNLNNLNKSKVSRTVRVIKMLSQIDVCCEFLFSDRDNNLGDQLLF